MFGDLDSVVVGSHFVLSRCCLSGRVLSFSDSGSDSDEEEEDEDDEEEVEEDDRIFTVLSNAPEDSWSASEASSSFL